jgi:hypothetical protein
MRYKAENDNVGITRKCECCKESFYISNNNIDDAIYYDKKTYHSSCFINICNKRSKMKREDVSVKWTWVLEHLNSIKQDSYEHFSIAITKEGIFDFIKDAYDVTIIPTTVWQKLGNIYNGTFKGMSFGIPPEHLLDMWKRKIDMLNGIASRNETKGIKMKPDQRINYDLSILVNKYDSYLKWLEKQKIIEAERETIKNENIVGKSIGYMVTKQSNKNDSDDISDLVDDIFG